MSLTPLSNADEPRRDALTRYGVARIQTRNSQLASAASQLEKVTRQDPDALAPKRDLVRLYADLGRDAAALRIAKEVFEKRPDDAETSRVVARIHSGSKNYTTASEYLARAFLSTPANRPAARLAILKELATAGQADQHWTLVADSWLNVAALIDDHFKFLQAESYDATELHHERALAFEKRGLALIECKKPAEAVTAFLAAAALFHDPAKANDHQAAARLNWNLTLAHQAAGDTAKALRTLQLHLDLKPRSLAPYQKYVELMNVDSLSKTLSIQLQNWAAIQPGNEPLQWVLAVETSKRDYIQGHERLQKLCMTTTNSECIQFMVNTYVELNRTQDLLTIADRLFPTRPEGPRKAALDLTPEQSDRQQAFANALNTQLAFAPALLKAAQGTERSPELWELLGWLAERSDQPLALETSLKQALLASRNDPSATAFERLVTHYLRHREWQKLLRLCDETRGFEVYRAILKSEALAELGREDEAFDAIRKTAALANFAGKRQIAHLHGILGQHDAMLKQLDDMLKEFNDRIDVRKIRTLRAEAYLGLNRIDDMESELRGLVEDDPDDVMVLNNLGYNLADRNRKLPEAERMIRRALEIDRHNRAKAGEAFPVNGVYLDSLGWVLFRRGELKEARVQLQRATELPDGRADAVVWDHLGDVCFRLDDKPAAKLAWTNAAKRYENDHRGRLQGRAGEVIRKLKLCE